MFRASDIFGRAAGAVSAAVDSSVVTAFSTPLPSAGGPDAFVQSGARPKCPPAPPPAPPSESGPAAAAPSGGEAATTGGGGGSGCAVPSFEAAEAFSGARRDRVFKLGHLGLGYYVDVAVQLTEGVRQELPETWRNTSLREERLVVHPSAGAGLTLERCDFGFLVEAVAAAPGQGVVAGEVIVAVEGRLLAGLSGPQMQASFLKRRTDGARLSVANLAEAKMHSLRDPAIVENWDAKYQRSWFFDKRTGKSSWVYEELLEAAKEAGKDSAGSAAAPIDLASFLSHGFARPQPAAAEPPAKKKKRKADANAGKDVSDLSRDERARWSEWNEGKHGGYTEQFLDKYKNCTSFPAKEKHTDKRLKGSVGPGQGNEYIARWTGSKNSFN